LAAARRPIMTAFASPFFRGRHARGKLRALLMSPLPITGIFHGLLCEAAMIVQSAGAGVKALKSRVRGDARPTPFHAKIFTPFSGRTDGELIRIFFPAARSQFE